VQTREIAAAVRTLASAEEVHAVAASVFRALETERTVMLGHES